MSDNEEIVKLETYDIPEIYLDIKTKKIYCVATITRGYAHTKITLIGDLDA